MLKNRQYEKYKWRNRRYSFSRHAREYCRAFFSFAIRDVSFTAYFWVHTFSGKRVLNVRVPWKCNKINLICPCVLWYQPVHKQIQYPYEHIELHIFCSWLEISRKNQTFLMFFYIIICLEFSRRIIYITTFWPSAGTTFTNVPVSFDVTKFRSKL